MARWTSTVKRLTAFRVAALVPPAFLKFLLCGAAAAAWAMPGTAHATLGNYPNTSVQLSANTTVAPDAAPSNTASINVSTSTNFKGRLEGNPGSGIVRVTDAHPAGIYTVTVTGFNIGGGTSTATFTLTVTTPATCNPVTLTASTNFAAPNAPRAVAIGDFNGDGKQDLATSLSPANVGVLLGNGTGSFGPVTNFAVGGLPESIAVGDFNGDGKQDLVTANPGANSVSIVLGDGAGGFAAASNLGVGAVPRSVAVGDFNGDGRQDLAVANELSDNVSIFLGDGAGGFSGPTTLNTATNPNSIAVGDFNGDGRQDLAIAHRGPNIVSILPGNGAGGFGAATTFPAGTDPEFIAMGDFNGDGNQDLAVTNTGSNNVSILLGAGGGTFGSTVQFATGLYPEWVSVGDFDGDGQQDLVVANTHSDNVSILLGNGAGAFSAAINFGVGSMPTSVAVGDFNSDGKQDLVVANFGSNDVSILLRQCAPAFSIDSVAQNEGNIGTTTSFIFTIAKTGTTTLATSVDFTTQDGSATAASSDYQTKTGTLNFLPGDTTQTVTVTVSGDNTVELDETFTVHLTNAINATISAADGTGTIINDEAPIPTPTPTATATATATPTATATVTVTATATPTATPAAPAQAINLATRINIQTGNNVGIGGFIITGSVPKHIVLRGIGPSMTANGAPVPGRLQDPVLELHGPCQVVIMTNDNWRDDPVQEAQIEASGLAPTDDRESAIDAILAPGAYTAIMRGKNNTTGIGLIEVYDIDQGVDSKLANISMRALVQTGDQILIAGVTLGNSSGDDRIVTRGLGPSLASFGIAGALLDPTLELHDNNGVLLTSNDDWQDDPIQAAEIAAAGLAPSDPKESAVAATLPPGAYTAILAGKNMTGVGLVEVYDRNASAVSPPPPPCPTPTATATATATATPMATATATATPTATPTVTATATPTATPTATATATPTATATATPTATSCTENFDGVTAPALPPGWVASNAAGSAPFWVTSATTPDTAPNDAIVKAPPEISDKRLDTPSIAITSAAARFSFRNNFTLEFSNGTYRDGGVLEVSSPNVNGGAFTDITDPAVGGSFLTGGYTGPIDGTRHNPIAGRMAWSGSSGGYIDTVVNLGPNLNGQTIKLRFRLGTDDAVATGGWRVDTISITGGTCP